MSHKHIISSQLKTMAIIICGAALAVACDNDCLTARIAKKAIEKETMFRDSSQVEPLCVGFYEINPAARATLDTLAKEGLVNCKISEYKERRRFERYTWWEGTTVYYKDVTHYFAEVSLTDEGRKYVVANPPTCRAGEDDIEGLESAYVPADSTGKVIVMQPEESDNVDSDSTDAVALKSDTAASTKGAANAAYAAALKKVSYTMVNVLVGFYKVDKVFDVYYPENYEKEGIGKCSFVAVLKNLTPFGKALTAHKEGEKSVAYAQLIRYEDKGWVVSNYSINAPQSDDEEDE